MIRKCAAAFLVLGTLAPGAAFAAGEMTFKATNVRLPDSTIMFAPGTDSDAINNNCLACHSAEMVLVQPSFSRATWQAEVDKMRNVYKAPITDADARAVVEYLVRTKGTK